MSISSIVVRGYGAFSDANSLPTLGYSFSPFRRLRMALANLQLTSSALTNSAVTAGALTNSAATTVALTNYE